MNMTPTFRRKGVVFMLEVEGYLRGLNSMQQCSSTVTPTSPMAKSASAMTSATSPTSTRNSVDQGVRSASTLTARSQGAFPHIMTVTCSIEGKSAARNISSTSQVRVAWYMPPGRAGGARCRGWPPLPRAGQFAADEGASCALLAQAIVQGQVAHHIADTHFNGRTGPE